MKSIDRCCLQICENFCKDNNFDGPHADVTMDEGDDEMKSLKMF